MTSLSTIRTGAAWFQFDPSLNFYSTLSLGTSWKSLGRLWTGSRLFHRGHAHDGRGPFAHPTLRSLPRNVFVQVPSTRLQRGIEWQATNYNQSWPTALQVGVARSHLGRLRVQRRRIIFETEWDWPLIVVSVYAIAVAVGGPLVPGSVVVVHRFHHGQFEQWSHSYQQLPSAIQPRFQ